MTRVGSSKTPSDPRRLLRVYKSIDDVPAHHRISNARGGFDADADVWATWREATGPHADLTLRDIDRTGRMWGEFAAENGFHHALGEPDDVNEWFGFLLERRKPVTVYKAYWTYLHAFYGWVANHPSYPEIRYDPTLMAAANFPETRQVWDYYNGRGNGDN